MSKEYKELRDRLKKDLNSIYPNYNNTLTMIPNEISKETQEEIFLKAKEELINFCKIKGINITEEEIIEFLNQDNIKKVK